MMSCWVESIPGAPECGSLTSPLVPSTPASNCIALCRTLGLRRIQFGNQYSRIKCKILKVTHMLSMISNPYLPFQIHFVAGVGGVVCLFLPLFKYFMLQQFWNICCPHTTALSYTHTHTHKYSFLFSCFMIILNLQPKINFLIPLPFFLLANLFILSNSA